VRRGSDPAQRERLHNVAVAIVHLNLSRPGVADLHRVNDGLDEAIVMNATRKNFVARKLKSLLQVTDRSNVELKRHMFI
jgi:hypothetical protein